MIDELRESMDRHAARVVPKPEPYMRVLRLRRRRRTMSAATIACVLMVVGPLVWLRSSMPPAYVDQPGEVPAALKPLLDSPTRGSLAGDTAFINSLLPFAASGAGMEHHRLPDDPHRLKVLFVGDLGRRRVAVIAGLDGKPHQAIYQGDVGDSAESLRVTGTAELSAVVATDFSSDDRNPDYTYLLLGPSGAIYEVAQTRYTSSRAERTWTAVASAADYVGYGNLGDHQLFRVVFDSEVLAETTAGTARKINVAVDPQPAGDRGKPTPEAANRAASLLATMTGLDPSQATFRVLWSDEINMPGTEQQRAYVVTVQAIVAGDSGGPYLTVAFSVGEGLYRDHPSGFGIAGADVGTSLIIMRLPHYTEPLPDLQIIGPPAGVKAEVTWDGTPHPVSLTNGIGRLTMPANTHPIVRVFDSSGNVLATKHYTDIDNFGCDRFDHAACTAPTPSTGPIPSR